MKSIDKVGLRENLDRLGVAWARLGPEDESVRSKMQEEIFCKVCELYYNYIDEITTIFLNDWSKFDPEKGSLSGFFAARISWRGKDMNRWNRSERQVWETDPVTGKKKRVYRSAIVQEGDSTSSEEGGSSLQDVVQADHWIESGGNDTEDAFWANEAVLQILISMLNLSSRLTGRAKNTDRQEYFRMFFTDNVTTCLHQGEIPALFRKRERDLFQAMEVQFLDYFMAKRCRTAAAIQQCSLKLYGLLAQGKPMEETRLPLPNDVFTSYLEQTRKKKVGDSAVSRQKGAYLKFMKDSLS